MAELVLATAGAWLGSVAFPSGILGVSGGAFGWFVGSTLGSAFGPKQKSFGPRIDDLKVTGTGYGQPVPWVAGSPRVGGTIIWSSKKRETATTTEVGKGGGSEYTEYTYDCDVLYMVSENEIDSCDKIFSNGKLVYNGTVKAGFCDEVIVYRGTSDQLPDPTYEAAVGVGNAPAYRGRGTILIKGLKLGNSGFLPNLTFAINSTASVEPDADVLLMLRFNEPQGSTNFYDSSIYNRTVVNQSPNNTYIVDGGIEGGQMFQGDNWVGIPGSQGVRIFIGQDMIDIGTGNYTLEGVFECPANTGTILSTPFFQMNFSTGAFTMANSGFGSGGAGLIFLPRPLQVNTKYYFRNQRTDTNWFFSITDSVGEMVFFNHVITDPSGKPNWGSVSDGSASINLGTDLTQVKWDEIRFSRKLQPYPPTFPLATDNKSEPGDLNYGSRSLSEVVSALMIRAGYDEDEFDISGLIDSRDLRVRAVYLSQVAPTRSAIEILQSAYYFTASKSDKIYFRFREPSVSGQFDYEDIGVTDSPEASDNPLPIKNTSVLEQPSQISLTYNNMSFDFNQDVASSDILVTDQKSTNAIQIPLGLLPSEAKGVVESMLLDQVAARVQYGPFRLPLSYAKYEPSDVVLVPDTEGDLHRVRLVKKTDMGVMLEFEGVGDDEGALIASGIADDSNQGQVDVEIASGSLWLPGDWPLFRDADDAPGYLALAKSKGDGDFWPGAGFFRSWDGVTFSQVGSFSASSIFGKCSTILPDFNGGNVWDESSVLRVDVGQGELSSSTKTAMQADLSINVAMVGSECIRFRLATLISPGVYDLSGLIRGFRGTEWAIGTHGADEDFALVNFNTNWINLNTNQIGLNQFVKAVTFNNPLSSEDATQFNYTGVNLKPFSVSNPRALYTEDGLLISWNRRTRRSYSYGGVAGVVAPLGEAFERYRLYFYDGSTLIRTEVVNDAQEFLYTEEMANQDGLSSNASVTIEIVQVSEIVGDGYPSYVEGMMQ